MHPTSYLDGLRGIASILVFFCHYTEDNYASLTRPYGIHEDVPSGWIQLPFVRIIFSGRPMVHIFFVISGFVLSYKPIKAIHARDLDKCYNALASSTFRRAFRLFGPCIVSSFIIMCMCQMGFIYFPRESWSDQLWNWKSVVFHQITWPWAWDKDLMPGYDIHLWTIPIEFAHSMLLFMVILMLSRVRLRIRQAMNFGLIVYCLACGKWAAFEFLAGLFLAEVHVLKSQQAGKDWESAEILDYPQKRTLKSMVKPMFHLSLVAVGLFIGGWPNHEADKTPGIRWFLEQTPMPFAKLDHLAPQKFWFGLSAVLTVWSVGEVQFLKRLFESPLAQYCGRVSYAVYICHGPVLGYFQKSVFGSAFVPATGEPGTEGFKPEVVASGIKGFFGMDNTTQKTMGWFVGLCVLGPMVIWVADVFWRAVDNPVVSLGRKMEMACLAESETSPRSQGYSTVA